MQRSFFLLFLLFPFLSFSQSNYRPGYVVTNAGEKIPGLINYKEKEQNPTSINFKPGERAAAQTYKLADCREYGLNGLESYQRFAVDVSQSKGDLSDLAFGLDTTFIRDTVFLKVVQAGKNVSLYSYTDKIKTRFYVKEHGSDQPVELVRAIYYVVENGAAGNRNKTGTYNKFVRQLNGLMLKNHVLTAANADKLRRVIYSKSSLLDIVSLLNDERAATGRKGSRFFIGAGVNSSKANYHGGRIFIQPGLSEKTSYAPMVTAGIDLFANPNIGRIIYRAELSFTTSKSEITKLNSDPTIEYKTHAFDSYAVMLTPQVIWNAYNSDPFKVFIGGGLTINLAGYSNNIMTSKLKSKSELRIENDPVLLNGFFLAPQASAGMVIKQKVEVFGNYMFKSSLTTYTEHSIQMARYNIGLKYLFGH
jgi:hypothetical protein